MLYCCLKKTIFLPVTRVHEFPVFYIHVEMWIYIFSQMLIMEWAYQRISNWTKYSKSTWRVCSALHPSAWELSSSWGVVLFRANHEIIETHTNYLVTSCLLKVKENMCCPKSVVAIASRIAGIVLTSNSYHTEKLVFPYHDWKKSHGPSFVPNHAISPVVYERHVFVTVWDLAHQRKLWELHLSKFLILPPK